MIQFFINHPYLIGLVSFLLGMCTMPSVIKIAKEKNFVVRPNKRMCHTGEIPNIGGINICFSFLLTYLVFEFNELQQSQFLLIGVFTIMVVGFVDDILILTPLAKLLGELLAGIALISFADIRLDNLFGIFGIEEIGVIPSYLLSFLALAAIVNAINLIDGVDGLASGLGIMYSIFFSTYFYLVGDMAWSILGISMIGSLAVFFYYNVFGKKQKIFMGDSGSLLLGYMITAFVFHLCDINANHEVPEQYYMTNTPVVAISVLMVPLFDTLRVSITRICQHKSPFQPDKNHIHHLLLKAGLNHLQTTCVLLAVNLGFIALGIALRNSEWWILLSVEMAIASMLSTLLWNHVNKENNA